MPLPQPKVAHHKSLTIVLCRWCLRLCETCTWQQCHKQHNSAVGLLGLPYKNPTQRSCATDSEVMQPTLNTLVSLPMLQPNHHSSGVCNSACVLLHIVQSARYLALMTVAMLSAEGALCSKESSKALYMTLSVASNSSSLKV